MCRYAEQGELLYLTIVHIWDKDRNYPFIVSKDPLPLNCRIEDGDSRLSPLRTSSPTPSSMSRSSDISSIILLEKVVEVASAHKLRHDEMMSYMRWEDGTEGGTGNCDGNQTSMQRQSHYVKLIADTNKQIIAFESQMKVKKDKKRTVEERMREDVNIEKKEKRLKALNVEINNNKRMVKTLKQTMMQYQKGLAEANAKGVGGVSIDKSDSSSCYDSD